MTTSVDRIWLDVPYGQMEEAKRAGARWDLTARRWYAPHPDTPAAARWAALPDVPEQLAGEDRNYGTGLFVDLVPATCWFTNVRSCTPERDWERLRRTLLRRAAHRCEICGAGEDRAGGRRLEAHERWAYDDTRTVQQLRRLITVCSDCHLTTHYGYACISGREQQAFDHLRRVTGTDHRQALRHINEAYDLWEARSLRQWTLDLSILHSVGITVTAPPVPEPSGAAQR